ncbi:peptidase M3 [Rubrivivax gelatinosus]|uniref:Peptidase M3 n=1 Tax=Rubrivivax gelatinosus TaxID=28068 RepID=A0ABS1DXP0_RUBGE|nr:M3 family metallopeptidase [Rubrivivax gelatinosus]MBK1616011.1 peptidase M3 [Rubrivivax gelatinosus]MBK1713896.1 peptidase M3 [Rubrivivax gelatinosus]
MCQPPLPRGRRDPAEEGCQVSAAPLTTAAGNPLLQDWDAPFGLPPFDALRAEHFRPAFEAAMAVHRGELAAIGAQAEPASFDNTVAAFDRSGRLLARIGSVFYNLTASNTTPELQAVQREMAAPLAAHDNAVYMDMALFARLDALYEGRAALGLAPEQLRLLERLHLDFVRAGAKLEPAAQQRYAEVMEQLAALTTQFAQNVLHDEAAFRLELHGEADLAGLPDFVRAAARQAAADRGIDGHVVTLSRSLVVPFLTYSQRRDLREAAWRAWTSRGEHAGEHDNRDIARAILRLRREQAALHGKGSYADYALADTMAGNQAAVRGLLDEVWPRALDAVARERQALEEVKAAAGVPGSIEAWDWRFWAEKVRQQRYAVDDAEVKPYFALDNVVAAAFDCANRLFGISFTPRAELPVYHPDVRAYEVRDAAGQAIGVFLQDNFARPSKRSGAWMSPLRWQSRNAPGGGVELPVILNNNNFAKGEPGRPTLLAMDDVRTLFHEFGHGLHGLLSSVDYERLSGTQVLRDFVELPSQLFEHWALEPEVLARHARHVDTGAPIPDDLVQRMKAARRFNQGYETVRYCASAIVDMAVHALPDAEPPADLCAFEAELMAAQGLPAAVGMNHRLVHFQHLFSSSSYAAGYYVYLWAEVLDADGYDAFVEAGSPFDRKTAEALRRHIYGAGNSVEPGAAYAAFRGRAPTVRPLLEKRGLIAEPA